MSPASGLFPTCLCFMGDSCECNTNGCNECSSRIKALLLNPERVKSVLFAMLVLIKEHYPKRTTGQLFPTAQRDDRILLFKV